MAPKKRPSNRNSSKKNPAKRRANHKVIPPVQKHAIVGIGASAGGLQALEQLFDAFPADTGMSFVVITHQQPGHGGLLRGLLQKHTPMRVLDVVDGMPIEPNTVYMAPAGKTLSLMQGRLCVMEPGSDGPSRMPIDVFFRSLAQDQKHRAVGIVLSGAGTDGTLGLRAIKGEAGFTAAQNPDEAEYSGMPQSAIDSKTVDCVLPVRRIPDRVLAYIKAPPESPSDVEDLEAGQVLPKIFSILRNRTGNDFSHYKSKTILRRIERRMNLHGLRSHPDYLRYLQEDVNEAGTLFQELLIGVTSFFRDPEAFNVLWRKGLAPLLKDKADGYAVRIWVPGCSTGEEAYSLAMMLRDRMGQRTKRATVQIFATDLDKHNIEFARAGCFPAGIANDVAAPYLQKFFAKEDAGYRIKNEIRNQVIFATHNMLTDPPFTKMDLISCRNLLIYLEPDAQRHLLHGFHYALKPKGLLFLGTSETVSAFDELFTPVDRKWKLFSRREVDHTLYLHDRYRYSHRPSTALSAAPRPSAKSSLLQRRQSEKSTASVEAMLMDRFVPASVIINDRGEIMYIHGQTGKFLEPAAGLPTRNILDMARQGLRPQLAAGLLEIKRKRSDLIHQRARVQSNGRKAIQVDVTVRRLSGPESFRGLLLVTFQALPDLAGQPTRKKGRGKEVSGRLPGGKRTDSGLAEELDYSKHRLQEALEELDTANEEFKATNEELQSNNEELKSTNEELETAKEELQSLNEELVTLNAELQGKLDELSLTNDDLRNVLNSTEVATIFLDTDLRIRRFTPEARQIASLIPTDMGRPLSDIAINLDYPSLIDDAQEVLRSLTPKEIEVKTADGTWYFMRVLPYRTAQNLIDGVVIAFLNITQQKRAEQAAKAARDYAESIVETVQEPLLVLDSELRIVSANPAFYQTFHLGRQQSEGRPVTDLPGGNWNIPRLRKLLGALLNENRTVENLAIDEIDPSGRSKFVLNARRLEETPGQLAHILVVLKEVAAGAP